MRHSRVRSTTCNTFTKMCYTFRYYRKCICDWWSHHMHSHIHTVWARVREPQVIRARHMNLGDNRECVRVGGVLRWGRAANQLDACVFHLFQSPVCTQSWRMYRMSLSHQVGSHFKFVEPAITQSSTAWVWNGWVTIMYEIGRCALAINVLLLIVPYVHLTSFSYLCIHIPIAEWCAIWMILSLAKTRRMAQPEWNGMENTQIGIHKKGGTIDRQKL